MTETVTQDQPQAPAPKGAWYRRKWLQMIVVFVLGVIIGAASSSGSTGGGDTRKSDAARQAAIAAAAQKIADSRAADEATAQAQATALAEASAAAAEPPAKSAFVLSVKVLSKDCFGSAGCNLTYRVVPKFVGPGDPNSLEVTYEVIGGEDGPKIGTFTIDSAGTATYDSEQTISTSSASTTLKARVTEVARQ